MKKEKPKVGQVWECGTSSKNTGAQILLLEAIEDSPVGAKKLAKFRVMCLNDDAAAVKPGEVFEQHLGAGWTRIA